MYYYRLKQMDIDGQFEYSPIRQVRLLPAVREISVRNTLVRDLLTIDVGKEIEDLQLSVFDLAGRKMNAWRVPHGITEKVLDLSELSAGTYVLQAQGGSFNGVWKIIKI